ncbi:MAG: DoxX family protein [Saprospiraceae bacterium]|nr:DoxX family protein [Saprospiraceae bacterium]
MTIVTLFLTVAALAAIITWFLSKKAAGGMAFADHFLQNFAGILFVISGFVKAVDPLGTAYKMEQYFTAFEDTCRGSMLKFMAPVFPVFSNHSIAFSVFMIVLEIVLGIMLIIGYRRQLSAWLFFIIMVFFTILTGFTFLTGYVPNDANFFEFSRWTAFNSNQMRVTDCGCFGDFIKLAPQTSFTKDLVLMIPAIWFLLRWRHLNQLFSPLLRRSLTAISTAGLLLFCFSNFVWNEPAIDFRPFKSGANIREQLEAERKAQAEVEILAYRVRNRLSGMELEVPYAAYLDSFKSNPQFKASWETLDQIKSTPSIPRTKISDFDLVSFEGESYAESLLADPNYSFLIVSPKLSYSAVSETMLVRDSIKIADTVTTDEGPLVVSRDTIVERQIKRNKYTWDPEYLNILKSKFIPLLDSLRSESVSVHAVFGGLTEEGVIDLSKQSGMSYPVYEADDLLLKTIMRSNPGLVLFKDGKIIHKWHHRQLPDRSEMRQKYLNEEANKIY